MGFKLGGRVGEKVMSQGLRVTQYSRLPTFPFTLPFNSLFRMQVDPFLQKNFVSRVKSLVESDDNITARERPAKERIKMEGSITNNVSGISNQKAVAKVKQVEKEIISKQDQDFNQLPYTCSLVHPDNLFSSGRPDCFTIILGNTFPQGIVTYEYLQKFHEMFLQGSDAPYTVRTTDKGDAIITEKGKNFGVVPSSIKVMHGTNDITSLVTVTEEFPDIEANRKFMAKYPQSPYNPRLLYSEINTYLDQKKPGKLINSYDELLKKYPQSEYVKKLKAESNIK